MKKLEKIEKIKAVAGAVGYTITDMAIDKLLLHRYWHSGYRCGLMANPQKKEIYFGDGVMAGSWLQSRCGDIAIGQYLGWQDFCAHLDLDLAIAL